VRVPAVRSRVEQIRANGQRLVKEVENLYNIEILRLPLALRELNWLQYFGTGGAASRGRQAPAAAGEQPGPPLPGSPRAARERGSLCLRPAARPRPRERARAGCLRAAACCGTSACAAVAVSAVCWFSKKYFLFS